MDISMASTLAEVSRFAAAATIFSVGVSLKRFILLVYEAVDRTKTAVVPTKTIFLAGDL